MPRRFRLLAPAALVALASACAGPPIPAAIEDVPVCADFAAGHETMAGSLRHPVRLRVLDGKAQVSKIIISGLRKPKDLPPRTYIADDNAEYNLEWAQCANERAPRSLADIAHESGKGKDRVHDSGDTAYDCGEATVYKTEKLVTRKHDKASHVVKFAPPPDARCWEGPPKPAAPAAPVVDAGVEPAADGGMATADAGAAATDAGVAATDGGAADAGAKKK